MMTRAAVAPSRSLSARIFSRVMREGAGVEVEVRKEVRSLMPREGDAAVPIEAVLRSVQVVRSIVFGGDSSV